MASSWSTSGRLASLRLPLLTILAPLLDDAAAHLRPVPDDFLVVEEERVDRHLLRRWHARRAGAIELALREIEGHRRPGDFGGRHEPLNRSGDLSHARHGAIREIHDKRRVR